MQRSKVVEADDYPEFTKYYLKELVLKDHHVKLAELKDFSVDEVIKLNKFRDKSSNTIFTDPVKFNDQIYSLTSLWKYLNAKDPQLGKYTVKKIFI